LQLKRTFEDAIGFTYDLTEPNLHDTVAVYDMKATGTAFQKRLLAEYVHLADKELAEGEDADARRFLQRAVASAEGIKVMPEDASTRLLVPRVAANMRRERDRLVGMLYRLDGVTREPVLAAHAQAMFDCWQEEVEDRNEAGIAQCRDAYKKDMAKLAPLKPMAIKSDDAGDKVAKPMAAPPTAVARYILLFKTDTTDLESESVAEKDRLMADVAGRPTAEVTIEGHTDRVGSIEYNEALSRRRADYVREALIEAGASADNISSSWHGEKSPAVDTSDDVPETANRRVEVTIR
jgi:outer membrane protein OmpA-like peptidoglycan-associated protein